MAVCANDYVNNLSVKLLTGQCNIADFIEKLDEWEDWEKDALIIAVRECGYDFDIANGDPSDFDVDIYNVESMRELAEEQVEQGLFGDIQLLSRL